jgi:2-hydroxychromene-2-carboxylate isomerase
VSRKAVLYFDFISPFAYLFFKQLHKLPAHLEITLKPLLFAGLLKHWGHKGPAEISAKRKFTYRFITWQATELGIPLKFPPAHPFNPVKLLRLAVALGSSHASVETIFDFVWREGGDMTNATALSRLGKTLGVEDIDSLVGNPTVKSQLIQNGEEALAQGVFGVPTLVVDGELFWGSDSITMLQRYLEKPGFFDNAEMRRVSDLPEGAVRS